MPTQIKSTVQLESALKILADLKGILKMRDEDSLYLMVQELENKLIALPFN